MPLWLQAFVAWLSTKFRFVADTATAYIRTYVPVGVGLVLSWIATRTGFVIDADTAAGLKATFTGLVIAAYYALARQAEKRWPSIGRFLLGSAKQPTYGT